MTFKSTYIIRNWWKVRTEIILRGQIAFLKRKKYFRHGCEDHWIEKKYENLQSQMSMTGPDQPKYKKKENIKITVLLL